jgi:hypothetical protein
MSSTVKVFLFRVKSRNPSAQLATADMGIPGVTLSSKYSLASAIRFSLGIGYLSDIQL